MNNEENEVQEQNEEQAVEQPEKVDRKLFFIACGCFGVGAVLLILSIALSFAVKGIGIYFLISSMVAELAAVSFLNGQKMKGELKQCFLIKILSYAVMGVALAIFVIGMIVSGSN